MNIEHMNKSQIRLNGVACDTGVIRCVKEFFKDNPSEQLPRLLEFMDGLYGYDIEREEDLHELQLIHTYVTEYK